MRTAEIRATHSEVINLYLPKNISDEALICVNCPYPTCKSNCKRVTEEKRRLVQERKAKRGCV